MQKSRIAGLLLLATAALAQQPQAVVEITSEPSHHLVFQNEYVRVFDVTVAPKASTLVHQHNHDYLFVTLGESSVVSARTDTKPVQLDLKDGEVRFSAGHFAHSAANLLDRPFHNITIELLQPSANVQPCSGTNCTVALTCVAKEKSACPTRTTEVTSEQWESSLVTLPPHAKLANHTHAWPHLVIAVTDLDLEQQTADGVTAVKAPVGKVAWVPANVTHSLTNGPREARFVALEFRGQNK